MAKKDRPVGQAIQCSLCGAKAVGFPGFFHRRCGSGAGNPTTAKHNKPPRDKRGRWAPAVKQGSVPQPEAEVPS